VPENVQKELISCDAVSPAWMIVFAILRGGNFPRKAAEQRRTPKRFARKKSSPAFLLS
jgi:hypothetical protein